MEQLRFQSGDLAICMWGGSSHTYNNGIIVKILQRYPVEDLPQWAIDQAPQGNVFWWVKTCSTPLQFHVNGNPVEQMEGCVHDSALQRLCPAPARQLEEAA